MPEQQGARIVAPRVHTPHATKAMSNQQMIPDGLSELAQTVLAEAAPSFALAGFSLGGYVAQEIARQAPDRIERLALIDTSVRPDSPERAAARRSLIATARLPGQFKGITDRMLPTYVHPSRLSDSDLI